MSKKESAFGTEPRRPAGEHPQDSMPSQVEDDKRSFTSQRLQVLTSGSRIHFNLKKRHQALLTSGSSTNLSQAPFNANSACEILFDAKSSSVSDGSCTSARRTGANRFRSSRRPRPPRSRGSRCPPLGAPPVLRGSGYSAEGNGCGLTLSNWGYAGFRLWFHLPRCHFGAFF